MVLDSINRSDIDIRKELLANIIVCGGNTLLNGVVEKLQQKISETAPQVQFYYFSIYYYEFRMPK